MEFYYLTGNKINAIMSHIRILVVEDEPIIAYDLEDRLKDMNYEVVGLLNTGEKAIDFVKNDQPDLILMDVQLNGELNGIETTAQIKSQYPIPIIYLTSNSDEATFEAARATKPAAFLSKPFRGRDLRHAIELALEQVPTTVAKTATKKSTTQKEESIQVMEDRVFLEEKGKMIRVLLKDILWIEAADYYCQVQTVERKILVTTTLKKFADQLTAPFFLRVHRSYVVNMLQIKEIGGTFIYLNKGQVPIGKTYKTDLMNRFKQL
jgi:DNA-binding LytR/AlgR family response regulator